MATQISVRDRRFPDAIVPAADPSLAEIVLPEGQGRRPPEQRPTTSIGGPIAFALSFDRGACPFNVEQEDVLRGIVEKKFTELRERWYLERGAASSITEMAMCKAYWQIIGLGPMVVPLIFRRMESEGDEPDMWFVALQMLTGADPVEDEIRGDFRAMADRWLGWAAANGYAW